MAVVSAAVCLAVTWRRYRWLPAFAFLVLSLLQRYLTHGIHLVAHRVGPPGFLHGTYPSGGSERTVVFFGLIAYFLWREFSGRRVTAIWAGAAVAALAFNEGYSRLYLGMHWTTDVLSGWFYGILLLALFILATRVVMGPARRPEELLAGDPAVVRAAGNTVPQPVGPAAQRPACPGVRHAAAEAGGGTAARPEAGLGRPPVSGAPERWPLVSVILPTRGRPGPVRAAISSVVGQTYPGPIECLVVHDQEPPDPALASLGTVEHRVKVITNQRTPGLAGARNSGLDEATGGFIATCDDDDVWHPAKLQAQIARLLDQPDLLVVGSGIRLMLPDGRIITCPARAERISQQLLLRNRVRELHSSTLAMRRDAFAKAGLYDEKIPNGYAEDYDWILRAARVGRIGAVLTPLADITKDSGSWWPGNAAVTVAGLEYLLAKHPEIAASPRGSRPPARADRLLPVPARRAGRALRYAAARVGRWPGSPHGYLALAHIATGVDRKHVLRAARLVGRGLA